MKPASRIAGICFFLTFVLVGAVLAQANLPETAKRQSLNLNQPIERTIRGGESHSFTFDVKAGHYARVEVEQKNIDVIVSLFAPDGELVVEMDDKDGQLWLANLSCIAEKGGTFQVKVSAYGPTDKNGNYVINLVASRPATPGDRKHLLAEQSFSSARRQVLGGGKLPNALELFNRSANLWREVDATEQEAIALYNYGLLSLALSKFEDALGSETRAAEQFQRVGDLIGERRSVDTQGVASFGLGHFSTARDYYQLALKLARQSNDPREEASALSRLAGSYRFSNENVLAEKLYRTALTIAVDIKSRETECRALQGLGDIYLNAGFFEKARQHYNEALEMNKDLKDQAREGALLLALGINYEYLGRTDLAREFLYKALAIHRERQNLYMQGYTLRYLGLSYFQAKQFERARQFFLQAIRIQRKINDSSGEGRTLLDLGSTFERLKRYATAFKLLRRSSEIQKKTPDPAIQAYMLVILGNTYEGLKQFDKARASYIQAAICARGTDNRIEEGFAYWNLLRLLSIQHKFYQAALYGKAAINVFQAIRSDSKQLNPQSKQSLDRRIEGAYRDLSDLLIRRGRISEAQAVLDLLKGQEFRQLERAGETAETVPYSKAEAEIIAKVENLVALQAEERGLLDLKSWSKEQESKLERLRTDIAAANNAFKEALDALGEAEADVSSRVREIKNGPEIQNSLRPLREDTKSGVVGLYTVLGSDTEDSAKGRNAKAKYGWVIMVTERGHKAYPIDVRNLNDLVLEFRSALSSDTYDPRPTAEKIYNAIFRQSSARLKRTLENDLRDYLRPFKDKTLMWSLDGVLRYIPVAALHDGRQYLVENYRNVLFTKQSFNSLTKENRPNWQVLGMGVSEKRENFDALPGVKTELETIVHEPDGQTGIMDGSIRLNGAFRKQMFFNTLGVGAFPVVHIASHYSFNPEQQDASFLLLGDGHLTFRELKENQNLFGAVDLLTLSACDTAMSNNGKEEEGFAFLAQTLGAKSVIASLWKISDNVTPELMIRFYKVRAGNPSMAKGEAFRQAQVSLLGPDPKGGKNFSVSRSELIRVGNKVELPLFVKDRERPFAHPYYWSSFVLIGNWR